MAHYQARDEDDCFDYARELLSYLPSNNLEEPPVDGAPADPIAAEEITSADLELDTLIPDSPNQPYDMHTVIADVLDEGEFLEVHAGFAPNIIVRLRPGGRPLGRGGGQPADALRRRAGHQRLARRRPGSCAPATRSASPS